MAIRLIVVTNTGAEVDAERVSDFTVGLWCDHCLKPSAFQASWAVSIGGAADSVVDAKSCMECGCMLDPEVLPCR